MADTKVTALTENTAPLGTDLLYIIDDPGGSAASQKITIANLIKAVNLDGWIPAGETWAYASATTFTVAGVDLTTKYYPGIKLKLTQTSAKYFIVTKVAFSTDTTVTVYGGTDYTIANAAVTSPYYSTARAPAGFPLDPTKWTVTTTDTSERVQNTPNQNTWYNLGSISIAIPIGAWIVHYTLLADSDETTADVVQMSSTLSTANNTESDTGFTYYEYINVTSNTDIRFIKPFYKSKYLTLTTDTTYYLNARTILSGQDYIDIRGDILPTTILAVCAYL